MTQRPAEKGRGGRRSFFSRVLFGRTVMGELVSVAKWVSVDEEHCKSTEIRK